VECDATDGGADLLGGGGRQFAVAAGTSGSDDESAIERAEMAGGEAVSVEPASAPAGEFGSISG
jgi:hypothetical protein